MRIWMVLIVLALAGPLQAEMAGDDYQTDAGGLTAGQREAVRARLAEQIAAERARAEADARQAQIAAEARARARAARPLGAQLLEARCLSCHDRGQMDAATFGTLGWTMTVLRMQVLNDADLNRGERAEIVAYLAGQNVSRSRLEWVVAALVLAGLVATGVGVVLRTRRRV